MNKKIATLIFLLLHFTGYNVFSQCNYYPGYCTDIKAVNNAGFGMGIQNVTLNTRVKPSQINMSSPAGNGTQIYFDNTSQAVSAAAADTINYAITGGNGNQTKVLVFVDYNNDGIFSTSAPELVADLANMSTVNTTTTGYFIVPSGTPLGAYRIRVASDGQGINPAPCGPLTYSAEFEDYTLVVTSTSVAMDPLGAGIYSPSRFLMGNNSISFRIANVGNSTTITSLKIGYKLGTNSPVIQKLTGLSIKSGGLYTANFSTPLNFSTPGTYSLKLWVDSANGGATLYPGNDTICKTFIIYKPLNGIYTIDPAGSGSTNFKKFVDADTALMNGGVSGPVTFNVATGIYKEKLLLPSSILGASVANSITFQSATGTATDVNLTDSSVNTTANYTVSLGGASYIKFKNMSISARGVIYGTALFIAANSHFDSFFNVIFNSPATTSTSTTNAVIQSATNATGNIYNYLYFGNCKVNNGSYGTYLQSVNTTTLGSVAQNLTFFKCDLTNQYVAGFYHQYFDGMKLIGNKITTNSTYTAYYGIFNSNIFILDDSKKPIITGNSIIGAAGGHGIHHQNMGISSTITAVRRALIANNMIQIGSGANSTYGMRFTSDNGSDIIHNSVNIGTSQNTTASSACFFESMNANTSAIYNNIFAAYNGAPALRIVTASNVVPCNYNDLYTTGTNLAFLNASASTTLVAWRTASTKDLNSVNVLPGFTSSSDLHITSTSNLLTVASDPQVITDFDGQVRCGSDVGADFHPANNDAGISRTVHPNGGIAGPGARDVIVVLKNYGKNTLTSANVSYTDGTITKTIAWTGSLGTCDSTNVTFTGSNQYTFSGTWNLKFYTDGPNGSTDVNKLNDTLKRTGCVGLMGAYTINPSGSGSTNFTTFTGAINAMLTCGIGGPVVFNVAASTYNEQLSIPAINGTSSINTVTFDGGNGNASSRILSATTSTSAYQVVRFNNCNNVIFRNLTIQSTGTTDGYLVHFLDGFNNRINNCVVGITTTGITSSNLIPVVISGSATSFSTTSTIANNHTIDSCTINQGYYNMTVYMNNTNNIINIRKNIFNESYQYGIFFQGASAFRLRENTFNLRTAITSNYGIYVSSVSNTGSTYFEVSGNKITNPGLYGIILTSCTNSGTGYNQVFNNMVGGNCRYPSGMYGIFINSSTRAQVYHNTINIDNATTGNTTYGINVSNGSVNDVRNNIIAITNPSTINSYNLYITPATAVTNVDYNNYYNRSASPLLFIGGPTYNVYTYKAAFPNGGGANSISTNPLFVSNTDLHSTAPCNNVPGLGILTDADGETRSLSLPDMGADEVKGLPNNDIGVSQLLSPVFPLVAGSQSVKVVIQNYGANTVTSANVNYTINGSSVVTQSWSGSIGACDTAQVTFTTKYTFTNGSNSVIVYTSSPNGTTDSRIKNDSLKVISCTAMNGVYTINPSGSGSRNFTNFKNAVDALACGGVSGPVSMIVSAGTYNEQVLVPYIQGTSATNTVLFEGGNGNATTRVITFATTASLLPVVQLNTCDYVTFRNFTFRSTGTTAGWIAHFLDGTNNRISNSIIEVTGAGATYTGSNLTAVVFNGNPVTMSGASATANNNALDSCTVNAGYYNVFIAMSTAANTVHIRNNTLNNSYQYGIYSATNSTSPKIKNNILNLRTAITTNYGIFIQSCNNTQGNFIEISGNRILNTGQYGIYLSSNNKTGTDLNIVSNNMVGGFRHNLNTAGIFLTSCGGFRVYHNSVDMGIATLSTGTNAALLIQNQNGQGNEVKNNHLAVTNPAALSAFPLWITPLAAVTAVDYNNYYSLASPFLLNYANVNYSINSYKVAYPSGGGANSYNLNPAYVSATDLHSYNTCNVGQNLTSIVPFDADGQTRSTSPDIGADEVTGMPNNDIGVLKINTPGAPLKTGTNTVNVTLKNYGSNTVTSATIYYRLNGGSVVSQSWSGSLATCDTANFSFSTNVTIPSGANSFKVFTSNPNSAADPINSNDTAQFSLCGPMSGTYTIGATGNYPNFTTAVNALICGGVGGPVKFNVATNAYYEQVLIPDFIPGISAANSVTFQSASGVATDVNLTYSSSLAAKNYTLNIFNAKYFKFKNMTISAIGTSFGTALLLSNNSSNDSFDNVIFNGLPTTTNTTNLANISCPSGVSNFIYFGNCKINYGAYGSYFISNVSAPSSENLTFYNCEYTNQYVYGMYNQNLNGIKEINNKIKTNSTLTTYTGIFNSSILILNDVNRPLITGNRISGATAGTGLYNLNVGISSTVTTARRPLIANNMIQIGSVGTLTMGIRDGGSVGSDYIHNSVNIGSTLQTNTSAAGYFESTATGNVVLNNSFTGYAGAPAIRINTTTAYTCNYNNLFTTGATLAFQSTTARTTLALWRTATNFDLNSVNVNPVYTSNFDLHSNQPAMDNAGTPSSLVISDIDGNTRCPNGGCAGSTANPDIGADEFTPTTIDVTVVSIDAPTLVCPGSVNSNVLITLKNLGSTTLTAATVNWSVNGSIQTPFSWTGSLAQGASISSVNIGSFNFAANAKVRVWTSAPNSSTDLNPVNDTANYIPPTTFKGVYTIGGTNPDFYTFFEAVANLNARGVCGPVTFNVRQGNYYDRIQINALTGSSATNFVTFQADPANSSPVELAIDGNSATADNHTIFLNGTSNIAFRNLRITNNSIGTGSFGSVVRFALTQDNVKFIKNTITGPVTTSTSTNFAVINHGTASGNMINRCILDSNNIYNGSIGVALIGNTNTNASTFEGGNTIRYNQIIGAYYMGVQTQYQRNIDVIGNKIWLSNVYTSSYGLYMVYTDSARIEKNNINNFGVYGMYFQALNYQWGTGTYRSTIINNMVGGRSPGTSPYGIYLVPSTPGSGYLNIFHNSVSVNSTATGAAFFMQQTSAGQYTDVDIRNNSFANFGIGAYCCYFYFNTTIPNLVLNYNNYYTPTTNVMAVGTSGYSVGTGGSPTYNANSMLGIPGYASNLVNLHAVKPQLNDKGTNISSVLSDIDGQTRPLSPSTTVDIGADEFYPPYINIGVTAFSSPSICSNTQPIVVRVDNLSVKTITNFNIGWSVNGVLQAPVSVPSTTLVASANMNVTLTSSFTFTNNTNYNLRFWTYKPNGFNDSVPEDDTLNFPFEFLGNASAPSANDFAQCGNGKPFLTAIPAVPSDSISWYSAATGGTLIGMGGKITGPYINKTTTFYAQGIKFGKAVRFGSVGNTNVNVNQTVPYGGMQNVTVISSVYLDSVMVRFTYAVPTTECKLYYKTGTFAGFETDPSAWTLLNSGPVTYFTNTGGQWGRMSTKGMMLKAGQTYSFYMCTDVTNSTGNSIWSQSAGPTVTNADLIVQGSGSIIIGAFGSTQVLSNWNPHLVYIYKNQCEGGPRKPLTVTVKKLPDAEFVKGSTFEGQFKYGDKLNPDVTEIGNTIVYNLKAPVGYTNSGFGSTWKINNISVKTFYGVNVDPSEYTIQAPSGSGPGTFTLNPSSALLDSLITIDYSISDLGPNFCDSVVSRSVMVAPTPRTNFKTEAAAVCFGEFTYFKNLTTIHSGTTTYKWYFGTPKNDSSDLEEPDFNFPTYGTFNVRLVATSHPWNVVKDTIITVEVNQIPDIKFKVVNACEGLPVQFINQTTIGAGTMSYTWIFGDNTPNSTNANPAHLYTKPGGYKVTLRVLSSGGCINELSKNSYQFAKPVANFDAPLTPVCANSEILFKNKSTIALGEAGYMWSYGSGNISTLTDGKYKYVSSGTYNVKLKSVSEYGCSDSITKSFTIKDAPTPDFTVNKLCSVEPSYFSNMTPELVPNPIYTWTVSDNTSYSTRNFTKNWANEGIYSVTLKAQFTNGCSNSVTKEVKVLLQPVADFSVKDICSGEMANFVNLTQGNKGSISYKWDLGNGTSTERAPKRLYTPVKTTTYNIQLISYYVDGCADTVLKILNVSESPECNFNVKNLGFLNYKLIPFDTTYSSYEWYFGDGQGSTVVSPTYKFNSYVAYFVKLKATNLAGCSCEFSRWLYPNTSISGAELNNEVLVYPNPNTGEFIVSNKKSEEMKIDVYNVVGSLVYSQTSLESKATVNLENTAAGVYMVKVTINGVTTITKVTVVE